MGDPGLGAGLAALAFWGFVAATVVAGIWDSIRKREARHETLRRLIESGQTVDQAVLDRVMGDSRLDRQLTAYGWVTLAVAPGLAVMGWFLSRIAEWALWPLLGAGAITGFVGLGLLVAAKAVRRD